LWGPTEKRAKKKPKGQTSVPPVEKTSGGHQMVCRRPVKSKGRTGISPDLLEIAKEDFF